MYRALVRGELEASAVRELSEWLGNAKQNPDASFVVDLSASVASPQARLELRSLLRTHADLQPSRRLSVLAPRRQPATAAAAA